MTDNDQLTATTLRLALDREVARHQLSSGAWPRLARRLRRQPQRRAAIVGVCTAIVAAAAAVTPYLWDGLLGPAASHPPPQPGPHLVIGARTQVSSTGPLTTGYGAVWIIGPGVVYRVDPATARTVATIPAPGTSGKGSQIVTGAGAVWATSNGGHVGVYRIDPRHNRVMSFIRLQPNPIGITVAHGRIWVTEPKEGPGIVVRIDPRTNRVSGPPIRVGPGPGSVVSGAGTLWVSGMNYVSRISLATGAVSNAHGGPWGGTDSFGNAKISRIDAAAAGSLWTTGVNVVQRVDPATGHVTAAIPVPHAWSVIYWHGLAWALTGAGPSGAGTVVAIDPASNRVVIHGIPIRGAPMAIAAGPAGLWAILANRDHTSQQLVHLVLDPGPG
jgi:DNA-binding beta-propeller fold protein YncE